MNLSGNCWRHYCFQSASAVNASLIRLEKYNILWLSKKKIHQKKKIFYILAPSNHEKVIAIVALRVFSRPIWQSFYREGYKKMLLFLVLLTLDLKTQTILFIDGCLLGIARVFLDLPRILRKWTLANSYTKIYIYFDSRVEFWTPTDRSLGRKCRCAVVWFWEKLKHAKTCAPIVEVKIIVYLKIMTGIQTGQPFDRPTNELTARLIVSLPIRRQKWLWYCISRTHRCMNFIQGVPDYMEGPHKESKTSKSFFLFPSSLFEKSFFSVAHPFTI